MTTENELQEAIAHLRSARKIAKRQRHFLLAHLIESVIRQAEGPQSNEMRNGGVHGNIYEEADLLLL